MDNRMYVHHSAQFNIDRPLSAPAIKTSDNNELQRRANADAEKFTPPPDKIESKRKEIETLRPRFDKYVAKEMTADPLYYSKEILQAKINRHLTKPDLQPVDVIQFFKEKIVELEEDTFEKITEASQEFQSQVEQARARFTEECAAHIQLHAVTYNDLAFLKYTYVYILQEAARQFAEKYKDKSIAFLQTELGSIMRLFEVEGVMRISFDLREQEYKPGKVHDWLETVPLKDLQDLFTRIMQKGRKGAGYTYDTNFGALYRLILPIFDRMNYEKIHSEYFERTKKNCLMLTPTALALEKAAKIANESKIDAARRGQQLEKLSLRQNSLIHELQKSIDEYEEKVTQYAECLQSAAKTIKQNLEKDSEKVSDDLALSLQIAEGELESNEIDDVENTLTMENVAEKLTAAKANFGGEIYDSLQYRFDALNAKIQEKKLEQQRLKEQEQLLEQKKVEEQTSPLIMELKNVDAPDVESDIADVEVESDSELEFSDIEQEPDNEQVQRYRQATEKYLKHLEQEIKKEGEIQTFVNCCNNKNSRSALVSDKGEEFVEAVEKYKIVANLNQTLTTKSTNAERIHTYHQILKKNRDILTKRRDTAFMTFAKGLGVVAATILGVVVGGVIAYKAFFGKERSEGRKFVGQIEEESAREKLRV